jgi:phosphatidylinositol alpha 1,6-mannosyltransferase
LRARFSAHARVSVQGRTWDKVCDALMSHYQDAIRRHGALPVKPSDVRDDEVVR